MWYDLVVLGILLFFTLRGAQKGMIWQLAGIAGIILCVFFSQSISAALGPHVKLEPPLNNWVVMFGAYLGFTFVSFGVGKMLNDWIEKAELEHFNTHLGAIFGLLKGVVLVLVMTFFAVTLSPAARDALKDSKTGIYSAKIVDAVHPYIPKNLHDALDEYIHQLDSPESQLKYANEGDHKHGDEVELGDAKPLEGLPGFPSAADLLNGSGNRQGTATSTSAGFEQFLSQLPNTVGTGLKEEIARVLANTPPEQQQQAMQQLYGTIAKTRKDDLPALQQQLARGGLSALEGFARNWLDTAFTPPASTNSNLNLNSNQSTPSFSTPTTAGNAQTSVIDRCLVDISKKYSSLPVVQSSIQKDISSKLNGLDPVVQEAVLLDWRYDLLQPRQELDPDTGTSSETSMEARIVRELNRRGIPLNRLGIDLQNRLQGTALR